ncbi:hypothetical protein K435DRAFT_876726 [Dendrothele bispora CBS 962.96]|uniref:Uncharacterized protein n=1 Tax=Dendrothele bispora (strain CBS 962.96) TaxID=1314807 RepID=A0A4V4HB76_DENBC|nr:hypothetical protein K435DRAFT_876726 [Dendrothele bispora CBS 962.96]
MSISQGHEVSGFRGPSRDKGYRKAERVAQEAQVASEAAESQFNASPQQTGTPPSVSSSLLPTSSNSGMTAIQELSKKASLSSISTTASQASGSQAFFRDADKESRDNLIAASVRYVTATDPAIIY